MDYGEYFCVSTTMDNKDTWGLCIVYEFLDGNYSNSYIWIPYTIRMEPYFGSFL